MIKHDIDQIIRNLENISFAGNSVLVTGGAGFLGSWLCETLIQQDATVTCLDNLSSGREDNVKHLKNNPNFSFIKKDIAAANHLDLKFDVIFHLASRASPLEFEKFPIEILKANTLGTLNALEIAEKCAAKFIYSSTSETYGSANVYPTPETYWGNVNPVGIRGCYDEAKRAGEALCMAFYRQHNVNARIARIFNTYGPRMRSDGFYGRVVPRFIYQAKHDEPITIFGDGSQTRSFCYVSDQVEGLIRLAWFDKAKGEVINIGNAHELTILELANRVIRIVGSKSKIGFYPLPPDDPKRRFPNIALAEKILNWSPKISLEEGLKRTIEDFSAQ